VRVVPGGEKPFDDPLPQQQIGDDGKDDGVLIRRGR